MKYDRAEAVRYMGAKKDDNEAAVLADQFYMVKKPVVDEDIFMSY